MNFSKINELKPYDLNCNVFDVYSYNGLSMQELLCQFFTKINECIKISNETIDLAEWLVNEGLKQEVAIKLNNWLNDGTLENIINVTLFENLNKKLEDIQVNIEHFGEFGTCDDSENFIKACEYTSGKNLTLKIKDKIINLNNTIINNFPNIICDNSVIYLNGECIFNRSKNNFNLNGLNIIANNKGSRVFNISNIDRIDISNFTFTYETNDSVRYSNVFNINNSTNIYFNNVVMTGVDVCLTIKDINEVKSKNININNIEIYNAKTGVYISSDNVEGFIKNVNINNAKLENTLKQQQQYAGKIQGASMFMFEKVKDINIYNVFCRSAVERIAYFNVVENLVINNVNGFDTEGIKVCGKPKYIANNFTIKNVYIKNTNYGGYLFRLYFVENGYLNGQIDNTGMTTKPTNGITTACYVKNIKFDDIKCDGLKECFLEYRIDEFPGLGYAYVDYIPCFNNVVFNSLDIKNICLTNSNYNVFNFRMLLNENNPNFNDTFMEDKTVIDNFKLLKCNIHPRNDYQGKLFALTNTSNLVINDCVIKYYRRSYSNSFISYDDEVTKNANKEIQVKVYNYERIPNLQANYDNIFINANDKSFIELNHQSHITHKIFKQNGKVSAICEHKSDIFKTQSEDSAFYLTGINENNGRYVLFYNDGIDYFVIELVNNDLNILKNSDNLSLTNVDGKICFYYNSSGYYRLINRTSKTRIASINIHRYF